MLSELESDEFYNLAAISKNTVPEDIINFINSHKYVKAAIRLSRKKKMFLKKNEKSSSQE